ncbi:MAG: thiamine-phosphate kinase [Gemmatimonadaceae bacterium]|nr:thiamine-phosphate kinase [Gemmatimonadaceae bacterium]
MTHAHLRMGDGDEFDAIREMLEEWGTRAHGIGDDAAVLSIPAGELLVASTDATIEGVHFQRAWLSAEETGARAAAAALSDLAAMAATPRGLLLALGVPPAWKSDLRAIARGIGTVAQSVGCPILGGNVTSASELSLTITVFGSAARPLRRSGGSVTDIIFVTGALGGPGAALRALQAGVALSAALRERFVAPRPRIREAGWLAEQGARAAIDISDGLVADAGHLARASGLSCTLDLETVPRHEGVHINEAIASGEEYELLVAMPASTLASELSAAFLERFGIPLTAVGRLMATSPHAVLMDGLPGKPPRGHDHFGAR